MIEKSSDLYAPEFPKSWEKHALYDLADWINGMAFKNIQFSSSGLPVVKIAEVKNGISGSTKFTSGIYDKKFYLSDRDMLFCWSGQPETSIGTYWWNRGNGWLNQHIFKVKPRRDQVEEDFLFQLLQYLRPTFVSIAKNKQTTGLGHVTRKDLKHISVAVPSFNEQRAIAATLGALDDKIESNQRLMELISLLLENYSVLWGGQLALVELFKLAETKRKSVNPAKLEVDWVNHYSLPAFDQKQLPEHVEPSEIKSNKILIPSNAVLVSRLNPRIDRSWWVELDHDIPSLASTEFACLTANSDTELAKVWLAVRHPSFQDSLRHRTTGTSGSHQRVRPDDVMTIEVPDFRELPLEKSQLTLALLQTATQARKTNEKLAGLRDTLLPELMSGRIRVPEAREAIEQETPDD